MKKLTAFCMAASMVLGLTACGGEAAAPEEPAVRQIFAMDTVMEVKAFGADGEAAVAETEEAIHQLEDLLSRTLEGSQVTALNEAEGAPVELDEQLLYLLEAAEKYSAATDGAFDITIAPVAEAWGFTTDTYQVPDPALVAELLTHVGMENVRIDGTTASVTPPAEIDLGGIAKGYASDIVAKIYAEHEVPRGLVYLGGNVLAWGDRPDGNPWRVGIQDPLNPEDPNGLVGVLALKDAFAITSGGYQRFFEQDGHHYHHIIDPATGAPAESGLTSVTVVADKTFGNGTMCDALSTALFVMGEEGALNYWENHRDEIDLVLVTDYGQVIVTDGLADAFTAIEGSQYSYATVS